MKINFIFSNPYEQVISANPIDPKEGQKAAQSISQLWEESGDAIEKALFEVTGLRFKKTTLSCYLNSRASFSDPLSLKIQEKKTMLDNLIHELIHILLTQNYSKIKNTWVKFHENWNEFNFTTRVHMPVHAIHKEVVLKIMPHRLKAVISYAKSPDYIKAWSLVDEKTSKAIIQTSIGKK